MVECGAQFVFDLLLRSSGAGKFLHAGRRLFEQLHIFNSTNYVIARVCTDAHFSLELTSCCKYLSLQILFAFYCWRGNCTLKDIVTMQSNAIHSQGAVCGD